MRHLRNLGSQFSISLPPDEEGFIGRECPVAECEGYFKVQPGTGLKGENLPCHCPYCGQGTDSNNFLTKAQVEYAKSVVMREVTGALLKDLKSLEFNHRPKGAFGIGISMKVTGKPSAIRHYRESRLETEVVCDRCTLRYTIYGVFGFCPDCGVHNSSQILNKNLELVRKLLEVAETQESQVAQHLIENALEDCVSAFDGFGRETCRAFAAKAVKPSKAAEIRFQNIGGARDKVREQFGVDFAATVPPDEWKQIQNAFQKRHLLAHRMGVIDENYLTATGVAPSMFGRKVSIDATEVRDLSAALKVLGGKLFTLLEVKK
ncbi:hypothetical protein HNR46_000186 [Haloferula luteola]|uniref:Uncharacterized protein n=1 Tax=Haloferula luteola TaxID=595692 RepID=A0A840UW61_9BACT|nr:hypothetical protein [Haloferula luteola]MBB5349965.1 hypothetical protein [Haloferula luteola]